MTKPIISVVGNYGDYSSSKPFLSKITSSGASFVASDLMSQAQMPINRASNAPYVFS